MQLLDRVVGYVLLAVVMAAAGLAVVQQFGTAVSLPGWAKNAGLFVGGAAAVYIAWSVVADALAAWREAGGFGFTARFFRRFFISLVRSIVAPGLAAIAAVSGSWTILERVGEHYGDLAQVAATWGVMLGAASLAIISKLPESTPKQTASDTA